LSTLRIFLDEASFPFSTSSEIDWRMVDATNHGRGRTTLADLPAARRIEVFLPPSLALRASVTLPPGGRRQARKLLGHALDSVLLGDPSEQHFAYRLDGDRCDVVSIERSVVSGILSTLHEHKIRPSAIYMADSLIPSDGNTMLWYQNGWARRVGEESQWYDAATPTVPPALLAKQIAGLSQLALAFGAASGQEVDLPAWREACNAEISQGHGDTYAAPVQTDTINLLQGEFAAGPQIDLDIGRLRPTIVLAAAVLIVFVLAWFGQWMAWRSEEKALSHSMTSAYAAAFPGEPQLEGELLAARVQLKLKNHGAADAKDAVAQLIALADKLHGTSGAKLVSLDYKPGRIDAEYLGKPEQIEPLMQGLNAFGKAEIHPTAPDRTGVSVMIRQ
jgi:type II secretion system protein L